MSWKRLRVGVLILTVLLTVAVLIVLAPSSHLFGHELELKAYFQNSAGLKEGAAVRLAGVEIGKVRRVHVRPEVKDGPVEVIMALQTSYEVQIPSDSVVTLGTEGVLGQTFADIDTSKAYGSGIAQYGVLKSREMTPVSSQQFLEEFGNILSKRPCDTDTKRTDGSRMSDKTQP